MDVGLTRKREVLFSLFTFDELAGNLGNWFFDISNLLPVYFTSSFPQFHCIWQIIINVNVFMQWNSDNFFLVSVLQVYLRPLNRIINQKNRLKILDFFPPMTKFGNKILWLRAWV